MTGITLEQAEAQLAALLAAQSGNTLSVSIGGRSVSYRNLGELTAAITFWQRMVVQLARSRDGVGSTSYKAADFRSRL